MPTIIRKRRAQAEPSPPPAPIRRRNESPPSEESEAEDPSHLDGDSDADDSGATSQDQMVKKLVRLALATEYSRQPLRRADIRAKVFPPNGGRNFKTVFNAAQEVLHSTFGMTLTMLPAKEKITVTQKRAAQRATGNSQGNLSSSESYILTSTLPAAYRSAAILAPPKALSLATEAGYTGLYSFIIAVIYLHQSHRCTEGKLERELKRMNAENYVCGEKTDKVLKRMEREGYIYKVRERQAGGEETVEWVIGPRGRMEVGERGVAGLVKSVYGKRGMEIEELERRLERSLGEGTFKKAGRKEEAEEEEAGAEAEGEEGEAEAEDGGGSRRSSRRTSGRSAARPSGESTRRRGKPSRAEQEEPEDDEEEAEEEEGEEEGEDEDEEE